MRVSVLPLALLASIPAVLGQNATFLAGLVGALTANNLTTLVTTLSALNSTPVGNNILTIVSNGSPFLIFAPTNDAFSNAPANITSDQGRLTDVIAYHVVNGNFTTSPSVYPNVTLGRTLLNDSAVVQLEGNASQVVAWAQRSDGNVHVLNQRNDTTVTSTTTFGNITIYIVDHVITVPEDFLATISTNTESLTGAQSLLNNVTIPFFNSSTSNTANISLFNVLNQGYHGFTLFLPNSTAVNAAMSDFSGGNQTEITDILLNHFINGTTLYSPLLAGSENFTSAGGETLSFSINATGQYVHTGNTTAPVIQPDVLLSNGVIHVIGEVLLNAQNDPSAASSAIASATSAASAAAVSTETQPIGFSQTAQLNPSGSTSASPSGSSSAAGPGFKGVSVAQIVTIGATLVGVLIGGLLTCA